MGWMTSNGGWDSGAQIREFYPSAAEHLGDRWYMKGRAPGHELDSLGGDRARGCSSSISEA